MLDSNKLIFLDGFIDKEFLSEEINAFGQEFSVCGPVPFSDGMIGYLKAPEA